MDGMLRTRRIGRAPGVAALTIPPKMQHVALCAMRKSDVTKPHCRGGCAAVRWGVLKHRAFQLAAIITAVLPVLKLNLILDTWPYAPGHGLSTGALPGAQRFGV